MHSSTVDALAAPVLPFRHQLHGSSRDSVVSIRESSGLPTPPFEDICAPLRPPTPPLPASVAAVPIAAISTTPSTVPIVDQPHRPRMLKAGASQAQPRYPAMASDSASSGPTAAVLAHLPSSHLPYSHTTATAAGGHLDPSSSTMVHPQHHYTNNYPHYSSDTAWQTAVSAIPAPNLVYTLNVDPLDQKRLPTDRAVLQRPRRSSQEANGQRRRHGTRHRTDQRSLSMSTPQEMTSFIPAINTGAVITSTGSGTAVAHSGLGTRQPSPVDTPSLYFDDNEPEESMEESRARFGSRSPTCRPFGWIKALFRRKR